MARTFRLSKILCVTSACTITDQRRQKTLSRSKNTTVVNMSKHHGLPPPPSLPPPLPPTHKDTSTLSLEMRPSVCILLKTEMNVSAMAGVSMVRNRYSRMGSFSACGSSFLWRVPRSRGRHGRQRRKHLKEEKEGGKHGKGARKGGKEGGAGLCEMPCKRPVGHRKKGERKEEKKQLTSRTETSARSGPKRKCDG